MEGILYCDEFRLLPISLIIVNIEPHEYDDQAKVERLRTNYHAKMMKKIAVAKKRSEQKRMAAEAQKKRLAEKTAAQAEYIRQTGRNPPSDYICCGLLG